MTTSTTKCNTRCYLFKAIASMTRTIRKSQPFVKTYKTLISLNYYISINFNWSRTFEKETLQYECCKSNIMDVFKHLVSSLSGANDHDRRKNTEKRLAFGNTVKF